jgi:hypothetical protein
MDESGSSVNPQGGGHFMRKLLVALILCAMGWAVFTPAPAVASHKAATAATQPLKKHHKKHHKKKHHKPAA